MTESRNKSFNQIMDMRHEGNAAMSLTVTCPECDKRLKAKDEAAGKKIRCPGCSSVFSVPAKSEDSEDDFMSGLNQAVTSNRKRRVVEDDFDDDLPEAAPRSRKSTAKPVPKKKKSARKKSSDSSLLRIAGTLAIGLFMFVFVGGLVSAVIRARNLAADGQNANWTTFQSPSGLAQIDMPGVPTFNAEQSVGGAQTHSLARRGFQTSLTVVRLVGPAKDALSANPAVADLMFNEMESKTPQLIAGAKLISSRRITSGTIRGLEMKLEVKGNTNLMRFYAFPDALIGAEFISRNGTNQDANLSRFFSSFRGPEGIPISGPS